MELLGVACDRLWSCACFGIYGMFGVHGTSGGLLVSGFAWGRRGCVRFFGLSLVSLGCLGFICSKTLSASRRIESCGLHCVGLL